MQLKQVGNHTGFPGPSSRRLGDLQRTSTKMFMVIPRPPQAFPGDLDAGKDFALSLGEAPVITGNLSGSGLA